MNKKLTRIKTSRLERRLSLMVTGTQASTALISNRAVSWWMKKDRKAASQRAALRKQAQKFVHKLGELKGSYVKIGQMMALFGEHVLPKELTEALHQLEHQTNPLHWHVLENTVRQQLGENFEELEINPEPLAAASLGQVHQAIIKSTGEPVCLKIQYPGVHESIKSDFDDVMTLLKMAQWFDRGRDLNQWLDELKSLLEREVDYQNEAVETLAMANRLKGDKRFLIPKVIGQYSSQRILALEYLPGWDVNHPYVQQLPQQTRNRLGVAMLDLFFKEVFDWGVLQSDPNFGNYRISLPDKNGEAKLILLDFGAVRPYSTEFLIPFRSIIINAFRRDIDGVIKDAITLGCIKAQDSRQVKESFALFCMSLLEPMYENLTDVPVYALNETGAYRWRESNLIKRVGKLAAKSAFSRHFSLPPKEFSLIVRKLTGVFSFIAAVGAEFNGYPVIEKYALTLE